MCELRDDAAGGGEQVLQRVRRPDGRGRRGRTFSGGELTPAQLELFDAHANLAMAVGRQKAHRAQLDPLAVDEYANCGLIGLLDACRRFDPGRKTSFKTYAYRRIHGVLWDEMRDSDHLSRAQRMRVQSGDDVDVKLSSIDATAAWSDKPLGAAVAIDASPGPAQQLAARELLEKVVAAVPRRKRLREAFVLFFFRRDEPGRNRAAVWIVAVAHLPDGTPGG